MSFVDTDKDELEIKETDTENDPPSSTTNQNNQIKPTKSSIPIPSHTPRNMIENTTTTSKISNYVPDKDNQHQEQQTNSVYENNNKSDLILRNHPEVSVLNVTRNSISVNTSSSNNSPTSTDLNKSHTT